MHLIAGIPMLQSLPAQKCLERMHVNHSYNLQEHVLYLYANLLLQSQCQFIIRTCIHGGGGTHQCMDMEQDRLL